jgi:hypothetical protein
MALAGCAGMGGVPATEPTGPPPGTRLADWLVSPPGTVVLGSPFPRPDGTFAALLLVTGRPVAAVRDVLRQAADAGFTGPSYGRESTPACVTRSGDDWAHNDARPLGSAVPDDARWLICGVNAEGPATPQGDRRFGLSLIVGTGGRPYLSHLYLEETRLQRYGDGLPSRISPHVEFRGPSGTAVSPAPSVRTVRPLTPQTSPSPLDTGTPDPRRPLGERSRPLPTIPDNAAELDPPDYPATLPGPGQPLAEEFAPGREDYRVLDGSQLVGPEFPSTCATGGFHAVLRLDDATIDDYDEMARTGAFNGVSRADADPDQTFRYGDGTATYRVYSGAGAGAVTLVAVSRPRAPTFLMLSRCND